MSTDDEPNIKCLAVLAAPQERIKTLGSSVAESEMAEQAQSMYSLIFADLKAFKESKWEEWCDIVAQNSDAQLKEPLLMWAQLLWYFQKSACGVLLIIKWKSILVCPNDIEL